MELCGLSAWQPASCFFLEPGRSDESTPNARVDKRMGRCCTRTNVLSVSALSVMVVKIWTLPSEYLALADGANPAGLASVSLRGENQGSVRQGRTVKDASLLPMLTIPGEMFIIVLWNVYNLAEECEYDSVPAANLGDSQIYPGEC